jgi:hypothetical protein
MRDHDAVVGAKRETAIIESHRFRLSLCRSMACQQASATDLPFEIRAQEKGPVPEWALIAFDLTKIDALIRIKTADTD